MTHKVWVGATSVILLGIVAIAVRYLWMQSISEDGVIAAAPLDPACDIQQGGCRAVFPDGSGIDLSIAPRPIRGLKPLEIEVITHGFNPHAVEVDFRGVGMNMGFNRPQLKRVEDGHYSGAGMLSVCVLERMTWEATVLVRTDAGIYTAPFRFETLRP
jgi:hypothetical protein